MDDKPRTLSASKDEPQLLSMDGGIMLRDFNPKGILRFTGRKCFTCNGEILDHWLRHSDDTSLQGVYWCSKTGSQWSEGYATEWDVPKDFGQTQGA